MSLRMPRKQNPIQKKSTQTQNTAKIHEKPEPTQNTKAKEHKKKPKTMSTKKLLTRVCISLRIVVIYNTAQNNAANVPS